MIKAVLFDVDGVLLDSFEANLDFFSNLMAKAGYQGPTREQYKKMFHMPMWDVIGALTQSDSQEEIKRIWEMGRLRDALYNYALLALPEMAGEVIASLGSAYQLGVVTGRTKENIFEFPALKELEKNFSVVVSYEDTEHHKPHPEPLLLAAQRLSVPPSECIYIGDQETDTQAANAAGMKNILYSSTLDIANTIRATLFVQLPEIISRL